MKVCITDQIVSNAYMQITHGYLYGLRASHIQKRLLSEPKLTYKRALETALSMEVAAKDTLQMTILPPDQAATEEVHQMEPRQPTQRKQGSRACYRCGSPTHLAPACPHLETVCRACGKRPFGTLL